MGQEELVGALELRPYVMVVADVEAMDRICLADVLVLSYANSMQQNSGGGGGGSGGSGRVRPCR